ncbi:P-loop NTPase family protein [Streptomyces mirabilis]|uniref:hypothetical protein n=1 Tax=Streptomyces mirabilis TaxID=68239 RepID=UPI00368FF291
MPRTTTAPTESTTAGRRTGSQTAADLAFLSRAMKAPALLDAADRRAERARKESWTHAEYLVACLQRQVSARESHGGEARVRAGPAADPASPDGGWDLPAAAVVTRL